MAAKDADDKNILKLSIQFFHFYGCMTQTSITSVSNNDVLIL